MLQMKKTSQLLLIGLCIATAGCTTDQLLLQKKVDYRSGSDNVGKNNLELPPELTAPANNTHFNIQPSTVLSSVAPAAASPAQAVLDNTSRAKIVQAGNQRWLVVKGEPEKLWPEIHEFWLDNGFLLTLDNPAIGIMETDWLENRAKLPKDLITRMLSKISDRILSTGELDRYRTRVERGSEPGTSEIYISHRGMMEVYSKDGSSDSAAVLSKNSDNTKTIWTPKKPDPEMEVEMLSLLLQRFGLDQATAEAVVAKPYQAPATASLIENGKALSIEDNFDRAWRRVGLALDRSGYVVYDRDRSKGVYMIRRADTDIAGEDDSSVFSKLAFWKKDAAPEQKQAHEYEIHLTEGLKQTKLTVSSKNKSDDNGKILSALLNELK
ncbi:outer membrane protein assembly factor BamC [Iodobacter ciconiae]|uniref:Outer membrane protein assembly factor BamC n=1 Tax=Iodobacter ciconiae TaxID=2496266 RepID=A0A3S8ZQS4_9NEIS|nr:outer membrane protein assembly factor BamC [Iodobacter ciconiae]AZN35836.1 outer membrane protein assembly factor BamC [Iodobacter ciconiae]